MLFRLDPTSQDPLFAQLAAGVRGAAARGEISAGERLPGSRELAKSLGLNVHTVLRGYQQLRDEGLIDLRRRRGAVVTDRATEDLAALRHALSDVAGEARRLVALTSALDGSARFPALVVEAALLEAIAHDASGDADAAAWALERALALAEPDGVLHPFHLYRAPGPLEYHRQRTVHAALICAILDLLAGATWSTRDEPEHLTESLTDSEFRVLRYLPSNLTQREIAAELFLSVNTVNTHITHLYAKLGAHRRGEAVQRARALGLLAPSSRRS